MRAGRWRRGAAGALDTALIGAVAWLRARGPGGAAEATRRLRFLRLIPAEALREQLRTPGQRLLGVRTVDRRTGERVALWRTLLLTAVAAGGQQLSRRFAMPDAEQDAQRERFLDEVRELDMRHPPDSPGRAEAMRAMRERHGSVSGDLLRQLGPALAASLLTSRLRRRLAPTVEVRSRGSR